MRKASSGPAGAAAAGAATACGVDAGAALRAFIPTGAKALPDGDAVEPSAPALPSPRDFAVFAPAFAALFASIALTPPALASPSEEAVPPAVAAGFGAAGRAT